MQLAKLTWKQVDGLSKDTPVVFPIAAVEQHGHHLPLYTDSILCGEVIRRAEIELGNQVVFAPLQWLGNSDHHLDFAGTTSAAPRTYLDMLNGLMDNFIRHGFRRLVFVNGHGGNDIPGKQAVFETRQRHRERSDLLLLFGTYWSLGEGPQVSDSRFHQQSMGHACEWETSMILRIDPSLVGDFAAAVPVEFGNSFEPAMRGWITRERTVSGHIGFPHLASPEKGEWLLERFSADLIKLLRRVLSWNGQSWEG